MKRMKLKVAALCIYGFFHSSLHCLGAGIEEANYEGDCTVGAGIGVSD